ncbi:MAG TPA: CIA30 family protein [Cyclobacteriaceae bacterium]
MPSQEIVVLEFKDYDAELVEGYNTGQWKIVDDVVMGGKSSGRFYIDKAGYGCFQGHVSLENNGGFSMVKYSPDAMEIGSHKIIKLRIKGDGKAYQLRIKHSTEVYYTYRYIFQTSGEWESLAIPMEEMIPVYRGRLLDLPAFNHTKIEEFAILIGNKKEQDFRLLIDWIKII